MPSLANLTDPAAVLAAIAECDELGREEFLAKYGYGPAVRYFVVHKGEQYDSKAIAGVAVGKQTGTPMLNSDFTGGAATVVPRLERLGFRILARALDEEVAALSEELHGSFSEGLARTVTVNRWERSANARLRCIEIHGTACSCCGMSFASIYGEAYTGLIHVHHLVRGSDRSGERDVDPAVDLVPVCPNCHAAIHYGNANRSIEEVRSALNEAAERAG